jgi:putative membrane protein
MEGSLMSAATAKARPAARPELRREEVRELRIVEGTRPRRSAVAILMLLVAVALGSVLASMVLNTRMAQTSFEIREQQLALNELEAQSWTMRAELDRKASPTELEKAAKANGMVPAGTSGFITLETGTVEGGTPAK